MKNLPEVNLSSDPLSRMLYGAIPTKLLLTAIELKVFCHLVEPMAVESLAQVIGTPHKNTRVFLDALAANDLLDKRDGRYQNTPLAEAFLVEGRPTYLGEVLADLAEWMRPALENLAALVKGEPAPPAGPTDPALRDRETEMSSSPPSRTFRISLRRMSGRMNSGRSSRRSRRGWVNRERRKNQFSSSIHWISREGWTGHRGPSSPSCSNSSLAL